MLKEVKEQLEKKLGTHFDYFLCHIYTTGEDYIPWHNDRESMDGDIASVSFGATRKFRLRKVEETTGYEKEYKMKNGDMIHMLEGCQRAYKHCVPVEKKIKEPRINLTFRKIS